MPFLTLRFAGRHCRFMLLTQIARGLPMCALARPVQEA
jgi:hypothetical protein